jgi:hypothetical protein
MLGRRVTWCFVRPEVRGPDMLTMQLGCDIGSYRTRELSMKWLSYYRTLYDLALHFGKVTCRNSLMLYFTQWGGWERMFEMG